MVIPIAARALGVRTQEQLRIPGRYGHRDGQREPQPSANELAALR